VHNRALLSAIRVIHREFRETYGSPRIWDALIKRGHGVGKHRIARLMRVEGIRTKTVKKWRATTQSTHRLPIAENTFNRQSGWRLRTGHGPETSPTSGPRKAGSTSPWCSTCTRVP
jgi:transposase InsO family protein